jgi:hypothetical protein
LVPGLDCYELLQSTSFLFENDIGGFGPHKGLWIGVVAVEMVVDGFLEPGEADEGAAADALLRDFGEEALDEIEPEALVGVKCRWKLRCLPSQRFTAGVQCGPSRAARTDAR